MNSTNYEHLIMQFSLIVRENFIILTRRESIKSYINIFIIEVAALCVITPHRDMVRYQLFDMKCRQHGSPKRWYPTASLAGVTTQKTATWISIAMETWSLTLCSFLFCLLCLPFLRSIYSAQYSVLNPLSNGQGGSFPGGKAVRSWS